MLDLPRIAGCGWEVHLGFSDSLYGSPCQRTGQELPSRLRIQSLDAAMRGADRLRGTSPHGSMERSHATLVQRVGIRACFDEISNYLGLRHRIPVLRAPDSRRRRSAVVQLPFGYELAHRHLFDEQLDGTSLLRGCRDMQRRVTAPKSASSALSSSGPARRPSAFATWTDCRSGRGVATVSGNRTPPSGDP